MGKAAKALAWIGDVTQVLVLSRLHPARRRISEQASTACRSLWFHARCKIPQVPLAEIVAKLGAAPLEEVVLPGPTDLGDVGSQVGYHALGAVVRAVRPSVILETGTYLGVSAYAMALNAGPACRIFTVDLPDHASAEAVPELNALDQRHVQTSRKRVGEAFLRHAVARQITQIREDSMTFRAERWLQEAELVYVDGGHSMPCITKDTENAFRVLAPDGTIVWDDYFHLYPDVVTFLDRLAEDHPLYGIEGTNYVIYSRRWHGRDRSAQP
ncbi:MAG TPA: class I SAM-dependent methyltransferase [Candidatus Saccharimonadales bacterium]|nr:class I SAM-dependent methyltransferase [Candidatus Saccharimonadales bacterium]